MRYSQRRSKHSRSELLYDCIETPVGPLSIVFYYPSGDTTRACLLRITFSPRVSGAKKTPLPEYIKRQFREYFNGKRKSFDLCYELKGSEFEKQVWELTASIPYGQTRTYKWIAEQLKKPGSVRAVGQALKRNALPIVVPCHRVIMSDGDIGGYSSGTEIKRRLLDLEYYSSR